MICPECHEASLEDGECPECGFCVDKDEGGDEDGDEPDEPDSRDVWSYI